MKKNLMMVSLACLLGLGLASCSPTDASSSKDTTTDTTPTVVEVDKTYSITTNAQAGSTIVVEEFEGESVSKVLAGSTVVFRVELNADVNLLSVKVDGKEVVSSQDKFTFVMPNHNVTIETQVKDLTDEVILNVSDVVEDTVQTSVDGLLTYLQELGKDEQIKFFGHGSMVETSKDTYGNVVNIETTYKTNGTKSQALEIETQFTGTTVITSTTITENELLDNGRFFSGTKDLSGGSVRNSGIIYDVVKPDEEEGTYHGFQTVSEEEANMKVSAPLDLIDLITTKYFASYGDFGSDSTLTSSISEDKKSVTYIVTSYEEPYWTDSDAEKFDLVITIDGDNFISGVKYINSKYTYDQTNDGNELKDDAVAYEVNTTEYTAVRDYKRDFEELLDVNDFVAHDYDVKVFTRDNRQNKFVQLENNGVYKAAYVGFEFTDATKTNSFIMTPQITTDVTELINNNKQVIASEDFTVTFDNGLGDTVDVALHVLPVQGTAIEFETSASNIYLNESITVTPKVQPESATQNVSLEFVEDESTGKVEVTDNGDGTFAVKGTQIGEVVLLATYKDDPTLTAKLTLKVTEKPSYEDLLNNLLTKTLSITVNNYEKLYLTFKEGGTGVAEDFYQGSVYGSPVEFKWTLDQDTLVFTITNADGGDLNVAGTYCFGLTVVTADELTALSGTSSSPNECPAVFIDRRDV